MKTLKLMAWILPLVLPFYLVRFKIGPLPSTLLEAYLIVFFLVYTWQRGWKGWIEGWKRLAAWRWPVLAWLVAGLIAVFVAPSAWSGLGLWRAYFLEPLLVLLVLSDLFRETADWTWLRRALFLSVLPLTVWALVQFIWSHGARVSGPFPYFNALSLFVTPIGAWAFVEWLKEEKSLAGWRVGGLAGLASLASLFCILLARSNGGLVAFLAVALAALLLDQRTRRWTTLVILLSCFFVILIAPLRSVIWKTVSFQNWSGQVRLYQWRETWLMLKDHWFWGAGLGGYPTVFAPYHKATAIEIFQYPHNILLNLWSETGLLGIAAFGWIVVVWVRRAFKTKSWIVSAPLLAILIHGLVDVPYFKNDLAIIFWLLAALTVSVRSKEVV